MLKLLLKESDLKKYIKKIISEEMNSLLEGKKSFVSHIVHDELVIDMADEDREMIPQIRDTFADNRIGNYLVNLRAGKNYLDLKDLSLWFL